MLRQERLFPCCPRRVTALAFSQAQHAMPYPKSTKNAAAALPKGSSQNANAPLLESVHPVDGSAQSSDCCLVAETLKTLNWRILPFAALIVMLSYIDRGNLGFVAADICTELNMNHTRYGLGVGLFGVGYITSQVPSNFLLRKCGATLWFALLLVLWGVVAALFSVVQNRYEFYALRFLLGIAEGGTFPGVWYFLSLFYPASHLTFPYSFIAAAISISSPLAAPLATGLLSLDGLFGFEGWRLLFFVEGAIPIVYGALLYWILPAGPEKAHCLTQQQKRWIVEQEAHEPTLDRDLASEIGTVLKTRPFWILTVAGLIRGMLLTAAFYWTTLIIDDMMHEESDDDSDSCATSSSTDLSSVALTAIPFSICAIVTLLLGHFASGIQNRSKVAASILGSSGVFFVGWVLLNRVSFVLALLLLSFAISSFVSPAALIIALLGSFFDRETRATAVAMLNTMEGFGQIVGPICIGYVVDSAGYAPVVLILAAAAVVAAAALYRIEDPLMTAKHVDEDEIDDDDDAEWSIVHMAGAASDR